MKRLFLASLIWFTSVACLAEEACEPAVDVADSLNVNTRQDCKNEKTGLNRLVHKMFSQESEASSLSSSIPNEAGVASESPQISLPVSNSSELAEARYQLLYNIGQKCLKGFRLTGEQYLPSDGRLRVNLLYECH